MLHPTKSRPACKRWQHSSCACTGALANSSLRSQLRNASYVWLPLVPSQGSYQLLDLQSWRLRDFC